MQQESVARVVLTQDERELITRRLDKILIHTTQVKNILQVAAIRSGTELSAWTEARLDELDEANAALSRAVETAPLTGD